MKNRIVTVLCLVCFCVMGNAQQKLDIRLNSYGIGVFGCSVDSRYSATDYYVGKVKGGFQWGAGVEYRQSQNRGVEILYNRLNTQAPMEYYSSGIKYSTFDLGVNNFMVAFNQYYVPNAKLEGYASFLGGITNFNIKNPTSSTDALTKFGWGFRVGTNIWASAKVGIKLQAQLMSATQAIGGGFYFGTGGGGAGLTSYSTFYQFGLGGGLVFKLGE